MAPAATAAPTMNPLNALAERLALRAPRLRARLAGIGPVIEHAREVLAFAAHRARDVRLAQVAASLTFTTVLSLVPLLAVLLAVFTIHPMFAELRAGFEMSVLRELLPPQHASLILRYLNEFAAKAAGLTAVGLAFLVLTALAMIYTVDRVLNDIWQVRVQRPWLSRLLVYWTLLTLGPVLVAASVSATSYLLSVSPPVGRGGAARALLGYGPLVLSGLAFAALYVIVPVRRVLWRDALVGGFAAALLGQVLRDLFTAYLRTGTVGSIYGAFAVVPLFLLWVYLVWFAILFGAAIAATLPRLRSTRFADERRAGNRFLTAVALLRALVAARAGGADGGRMSLDDLARTVRTYPEETERLLAELERLDYVAAVDSSQGVRWLLVCDPQRRCLREVFARLALDPANTLAARDPTGLGARVEQALAGPWIAQPLARLVDAPRAGTD